MSYEIFISHSSRDAVVAHQICEALEQAELRCWIAPRDILPGQEWPEAILAGINHCRIMLLVFSSSVNLSPQIKREVERAVDRSMPILPLRIDQALPSGSFEYFIMTNQWFDASIPPIDQYLQRLTHNVRALLDGPPLPPVAAQRVSSQRNALLHCEIYHEHYAPLSSFDDDVGLPREKCAIRRNTCDLESEKLQRNNPQATSKLFADADLIDELAGGSRRRLWILGSGGLGKTEFSKLCALRLAEKFHQDPASGLLPLRIELKSLDPTIACNSPERLLKNHFFPDDYLWAEEYLVAGRVVFILDGVDELRIDRQTFNDSLLKLMQQRKDCAFVVTGRGDAIEPELAKPHGFDRQSVHVLKPIEPEKAKAYVTAFFEVQQQGERGAPLVELLDRDSTVMELVCNSPLLLAMACQVHLANREVTSNPLDLIERGLSVIFERRRSRHVGTVELLPEDDVCLKVLSCLAAHTYLRRPTTGADSLTFTRQEGIAWLRQNRESLASAGVTLETDEHARRLLLQLTPGSGIMGWSSRDGITFSNRVLVEYLAARWVVESGYPHWPHREHPYTTLPDLLERQISDFWGDNYWPVDRQGIRYWLTYLLERDKPQLLEMLGHWQVRTAATYGLSAPPHVCVASDSFATILQRVFGLMKKLHELGSTHGADGLFDAVVERIGYEATLACDMRAMLLECCSLRRRPETLKFIYSCEHRDAYSAVAYVLMPHLRRMFNGKRDDDGQPITDLDTWQFALGMGGNLITKHGRSRLLLDAQERMPFSELEKQVLIDCFEAAARPTLEFRLLDILALFAVAPPQQRNLRLALRASLDTLRNRSGIEREYLEKSLLELACDQSIAQFATELGGLFEDRMKEGHRKGLGDFAQVISAHPPEVVLTELCKIPASLQAGQRITVADAKRLAEIIVRNSLNARFHEDPAAELLLAEFSQIYPCHRSLLSIARGLDAGRPLFPLARQAVIESLEQSFWKNHQVEHMRWLAEVESSKFQEIRGHWLKRVDDGLSTSSSEKLAAEIFLAPEVRKFCEFPDELFGVVETQVAQWALAFGSRLMGHDYWLEFEQIVPAWRQEAGFLTAVSRLITAEETELEYDFLSAVLAAIRRVTAERNSVSDRLVERLGQLGSTGDLSWVKQEPTSELLANAVISILGRMCGKSLLFGDSVIKTVAEKWPTHAAMRRACIELITQCIETTHRSLVDKAAEALLDAWPGDHEILRAFVEAGLASLIHRSSEWTPWMIFWEAEGVTAWLPECSSGYERVPVEVNSVRGNLLVCLRSNVRRGLPSGLLELET